MSIDFMVQGPVASSGGAVKDFYNLLTETTTSNNSTSTVTLWHQSSWDDYDDLLLIMKTQQVSDTNTRNHRIWMNNTSSNYAITRNGIYNTGSTVYRDYDTSDRYLKLNQTCPGYANTSSWMYGQIRIAMHQGADSNNIKPCMLLRMTARNSDNVNNQHEYSAVQWDSMSGGVSRIDIRPQYDNTGWMNFKSGSKFTLYGLAMQG